jgi:hypothetical protein
MAGIGVPPKLNFTELDEANMWTTGLWMRTRCPLWVKSSQSNEASLQGAVEPLMLIPASPPFAGRPKDGSDQPPA